MAGMCIRLCALMINDPSFAMANWDGNIGV
jgi:hypothetical protein